MDRRDFLKTTGVAAAAAATSAAPVAAVGPQTPAAAPSILRGLDQLVLGTTFDLERPGVGDWVRRLAQRLEATSAGRLRLHTVAIASGAVESAQCADVDITLTSPAEDTGTNAAALVLAGLPGRSALAGLEHAAWLELGGGQILWDEWAGAHGVKP